MDYVDLGFEIFGVRGYEDVVTDAQEFGENVIPLVKAEVERREADGWIGGAELAARIAAGEGVPDAPEPSSAGVSSASRQ